MKRSETTPLTVLEASEKDAPAILALADVHRDELGAIIQHRQWLLQQVERGEIFVAKSGEGQLIGFVVFSHQSLAEHENTTVYYLCTSEDYRGQGAGKLLMEAVASDARIRGKKTIDLKCPAHAPANYFYKSIGYKLLQSETDREGNRLNFWTLRL
ncbi:MAG: GNAT family N-acetyltransferase [Deltaproteobacteria bacterium]|nr:MAG: GNAT family N-acetyltransferase [Deltaproteobacteria bacterium]